MRVIELISHDFCRGAIYRGSARAILRRLKERNEEFFKKPLSLSRWFRARRRDKRCDWRESSAVRTEKLGRCAEDGGRCVVRVRRLVQSYSVLWFCQKHERTTVRWCANTCETRLGCADTGVRAVLSRTRVRSRLDRGGVDQFVYDKRHRRSCIFGLSAVVDPRHSRRRRVSYESESTRDPRVERRTTHRRGRRGGKRKHARIHTPADGFDTGDKVLPDFGPVRRTVEMLKQLQMGMRAFLLMASRVWTCICFLLKKQVRAVSRCFAPSSAVGHESYYEPSDRRAAFSRSIGFLHSFSTI